MIAGVGKLFVKFQIANVRHFKLCGLCSSYSALLSKCDSDQMQHMKAPVELYTVLEMASTG